ncbi:MAG TPA: cysteine desulfurase [Actinomycetota bacterium]|nr:cysteine desulfurase [Actinomycetota bacterium]
MAGRTVDAERIRKDFPIFERDMRGKPLAYLDSAATSQKPRQVIDALTEFWERRNANVHRGVYEIAEEATAAYEGARRRAAAFLGAPDPRTIVFTRGTTESINLVAHGWGTRFLRPGDEVLLTELEHHSNIVPWQMAAQRTGAGLRYVPITDDGLIEADAVRQALTDRTRLVAITGMSNVLGTIPPIAEIVTAAHDAGALVLVDGAQMVSHVPVDVQALGVDFLAFSGHKMLGPTASGGLYGRPELLAAMDPFLGGGEMIQEVHPDRSTYKDAPWKFEAGTMPFGQAAGLATAIDYLDDVGMDAVREHERELTGYAIERLVDAGATVFGTHDPDLRGGAVSFWFRDVHPHDVATVLDQEGVAIRAGHHCAQILMRRLGVPATARASFYLYNTHEEIDRLADGLARAEGVFG